jgi:hypothetical protein
MTAAVLDNMGILGVAVPEMQELAAIAAASLGESRVELLSADAAPLAPVYNMTTGGLWRVRGTARTSCGGPRGTIGVVPFSVVVKLIQSPLLWSGIGQVPEPLRTGLVERFPWQTEAHVYGSELPALLPRGGRMPHIFRMAEVDPQRITIWMEDMAEAPAAAWTDQRFAGAARFLGRLAGSRQVRERGPSGTAIRDVEGLKFYLDGVATAVFIPGIQGAELWAHPAVAAAADARLITGLRGLTERARGLLDIIGALPALPAHGDASPQNLLIDPDGGSAGSAGDAGFTVIDWGMYGFACVGFDLGQLLAGWVNQGQLHGSELYRLEPLCLAAYCEGLAESGTPVAEPHVRRGHAASMALFTGLAAVATQRLAEPDSAELRSLVSGRLEMARFILELLASTD